MITRILSISLVTSMIVTFAQASYQAKGKILIDQHCSSCHSTEPYTNRTRTITSLPGLSERVQICAKANGLQWGEAEVSDVTTYLNENFYHFSNDTP